MKSFNIHANMKKSLVALIIIALVINCGAENLNNILFDNGEFDFFDLTHNYNVNKESLSYLIRDDAWYDEESDTCKNERYSTRLDVRFIFSSQGYFADTIPTTKLILPLIIADISDQVNGKGDFVLHPRHLDFMLNNYFNRLNQPCLIIFKFGWSKYYNSNPQRYYGNGNYTSYPGLSEELAKLITTSYKNIVGLGVDLPSADTSSIQAFPATDVLFKAGLYVLTNVKLDDPLPEAKCTGLVMPLKVKRGIGSPIRLMAICPKVQGH